ncbi:MAG: phosphohistidine phosphatase SixA [Pseudomonadales bacterium]|nr:phosphohistidine phosphatase SixA [Pseudomonadales bacterium]
MNLLLMRHGMAELGRDDFKRSLTEEGIKGVRQTANALIEQLVTMSEGMPSKIIASPLLRSQQTAQIVIDELKLDIDFETLGIIRPESDIESFLAFLEHKEDEGLCLYVSHQPFVGLLMYHVARIEEFMDTADLNYVSIRTFSQDGGDLKWKISA